MVDSAFLHQRIIRMYSASKKNLKIQRHLKHVRMKWYMRITTKTVEELQRKREQRILESSHSAQNVLNVE